MTVVSFGTHGRNVQNRKSHCDSQVHSSLLCHHIIIRGIERRKIFRDDQDKDQFVDRLAILLPETQTSCYAWALI